MYSKWIKSGFVLAMLLVSMVSLSMAACPWLIKNELYTAQCGVEKIVPASAGLLANDPTATAVLNPDDVTIDEKYGTLDVRADGSFVFDPSPDIQSGTYVQFKYNATNGVCAATVAGLAKIQVSCKCRPQVANVTLCLPTTLAEIKDELIDAGVDCLACGTAPTPIDLTQVQLAPGTWPFFVKCPGCQAARGWITLVPGCTAVAPDLEFCGPVTLAQVLAGINAGADCTGTGCDQAPVIDTSGLNVVGEFVTGGSYTATCGAGSECADTDTGTVTVTQKCVVEAPAIEICAGNTIAEVQEEIGEEVVGCTGAGCDATPVITFNNVTMDGTIVTGGSYTVTCTVGPNCVSTAEGPITVVNRCQVTALNLEADCVTPDDVRDLIAASLPCGDCDLNPIISLPVLPVDADGFVLAGTYTYTVTCNALPEEDCSSSASAEIVIAGCQIPDCPCEATADPVEVCLGKVKIPALVTIIQNGNATCEDVDGFECDATPVIDTSLVTVDRNGYVTGGTYTARCKPNNVDCIPVNATATVTAIDCCTCEANAPDICVPYICDWKGCHQYTLSDITNEITSNGGGCSTGCTMTLKFYNSWDLNHDIPFSSLSWNNPAHSYTYKVICTKGTCVDTDTGKLSVSKSSDCSCNTCHC